MKRILDFVRRVNEDSTIDSICTKCFQTVASGEDVFDLSRAEQAHTCEPLWLSQQHYWEIHRASMASCSPRV
jgi:hypothetical protein